MAWLAACHEKLDAAVAAAYGWPPDLSEAAILERLLALNLSQENQGRALIRNSGDMFEWH